MREIVFDTETTGLDPISGDRLVEIGCIEMVNRFPTGKVFHRYLNPERDMPEPAFKVHGLSVEFLKDKPLFADVAEELVAFIGDDGMLVAHNAMFDLGFLNAELKRAGKKEVNRDRLVDTLMLARRKHPGGSNRLDDLCQRYKVDNSRRTKHGALLDAELLAEVYLELIGARQAMLGLTEAMSGGHARAAEALGVVRPQPLPPRVTEEERAAHRRVRRDIGRRGDLAPVCAGGKAVRRFRFRGLEPADQAVGGAGCWPCCCATRCWYSATKSIGSSSSGGKPPLRVADEMISRANGNSSRGHSIITSACKVSAGTFWMRNTPANTSSKLNSTELLASALPSSLSSTSKSVGGVVGRGGAQRIGVDVDLNADLRLHLRLQRARRVRILEREILDVLGDDAE